MKYKKAMIVLILAVFLFSIAAASASDVNETVIASGDDSQIELTASDEVTEDNLQTSEENTTLTQANDDETVGAESDSQTLSEGEGTYYDLRDEIGSGGNKSLTKSLYSYTGGDTIEITTSGVINGNGAVIDMAESTIRAFTVSASDVTIKNLTIKNANYNGNGGAIYFSSSGTVTNCNFTDNSAEYGGAIRFNGEGTVSNCNFINNKATGTNSWGGAIYMSSGSVTNCNFTDNTASGNGGAIYIYSGSVENCNFTNNKATGSGSWGGAIMIGGTGTVTNCNFINNSAKFGGAVYFFNNVEVTNCNFINNKATGTNWAGAIYMSSGSVTNCNFTDNTASGNGGAIYIYSGSVENCNFINNTAQNGGAIYFVKTGTVTNCNFADNRASNQAGAIHMNLGNVSSCNFNNNSAKFGGAVYSFSGSNIRNCNFTDNQATGSGGGAVRFDENGNVESCNFINNKATSGKGGAIYFYQKNSYVADCIFVNNSAGNFSAVHLSPTGTISYCIFINNSADYGVVGNSVDAQGDTVIANNIFLNNKVILNVINFASTEKVNGDYNWFGNTADNYTSDVSSNTSNIWLFLNATAVPDSIPVLGTSNIVFSLYAYNKKTGDVFYYNNTLLKPVNLTLSATGGDVDNTVRLGNAIRYDAADSIGKGSVTAAIENVAYTIELSIKHNPDLSVSSQQVFYSNNTIITTSYNSSATGKVKIILKGKYNSYVLRRDLNTTISLGKIVPDDYKVSVIYYGDESFAPSNATSHLEVYPAVYLSVNITSDNDAYFIGDTVIWTIAIHNLDYSLEATNVTMAALFSSKFVLFGAFTDNGTYNLDEGVWQIGFMASGSTATLKLFGYGNSVGSHILNHVAVVCNEDNLGDMFGYNYIDLVDLSVIEKTSSDNNPYCGNEITYDLTISNNASINYTNTLSVVDSLPDGLKFVETLNISGADLLSETVDGKLITWNITNIAAGTNAVITIKVRATNTGSLTNNMTIISAIKNNHTVNCTVEVREKIKTELTANAVTTTYNVNKNLVITLKDVNGNPIGGAQITVNLNGAKTFTTDSNGQVKVSTAGLTPKTYTAKITFAENTNYLGSSADVKVIIKKATPIIKAKKKTYRAKKKTKKFTITLKDNAGKPIENAKVRLMVKKIVKQSKKKSKKKSKSDKKKNYAKTNSKGKATFKVLRNKPGKYNAKVKFYGDQYYTKATKTVKIVIK